ncbi:MAG TPA: hypothetical protein VM491_10025, partial [Burkholderiaceae bacterium]|nr:hypothetical protein [Burkholderiaceae bacterium]
PRPPASPSASAAATPSDAAGAPAAAAASAGAPPDLARVQPVIEQRCTGCHSARPTFAGFAAPPANVALDTADQIVRHAAAIHRQTVVSRAMPIGNLTAMTEEERALIDRWYVAQQQRPAMIRP